MDLMNFDGKNEIEETFFCFAIHGETPVFSRRSSLPPEHVPAAELKVGSWSDQSEQPRGADFNDGLVGKIRVTQLGKLTVC